MASFDGGGGADAEEVFEVPPARFRLRDFLLGADLLNDDGER